MRKGESFCPPIGLPGAERCPLRGTPIPERACPRGTAAWAQSDPWHDPWIWVLPPCSFDLDPGPLEHAQKASRSPEKRAEQAQLGHQAPWQTHVSSFPRYRSMSPETPDIATFTIERWKQSKCLIVRHYLKEGCYVHKMEWLFSSYQMIFSKVFITWACSYVMWQIAGILNYMCGIFPKIPLWYLCIYICNRHEKILES